MTENSFEYKTLRFLNDRFELYDITEFALKTALYDIPESEFNQGITSLRNIGYIKNKDLYEKGLTITKQGQIRLNQMQKVVDSEKNQLSSSYTKGYSNGEKISIISVICVFIGGAFFFGMFFGQNRFDKEKIELTDANKELKIKYDSISKVNNSLTTRVKEQETVKQPTDLITKVSISFLSPTSIFKGQILINATRNSYGKALLTFEGIIGVTAKEGGLFDKKEIEVTKGNRFYIKDENKKIWTVNVLGSSVSVDLEIIEKTTKT